ncbi:thiamine diphosphokinase [Enterococcus faecalis 13-SD-W-01]|nr:thiamine diphosphokinase [Enterococcus faecalis 13-SD-W-01]
MKILLAAGAKPATWPQIQTSDYDYFIGIDRGSLYLLEAGVPLDLAVGDFDSLNEAEKKLVFSSAKEVRQSPAEKDDTDTQLGMVSAFERFPEASVTLIGATGGRLDHLLANLWLGLEPRFQPFLSQITLLDRQNHFTYYLPGEHRIHRQPNMKYLAYCCLTPVESLTLKESKYTLTSENVSYPTSYASNEFLTETASFSFTKGVIAVIQSKDE